MSDPSLSEGFASQFAMSVAALLERGVTATASHDSIDWWAAYEVCALSRRQLVVGFGEEDAKRLAKTLGASDEAGLPVVTEVVQSLVDDVARSLSEQSRGRRNLVARPLKEIRQPAAGAHRVYAIVCDEQVVCRVACWEPGASTTHESSVLENLGVILDIELPLTVRFGETEMTLQSICGLGPGSVVDLGRTPDEPVDVLVNGRLVARGEVIVVSGNYGVRVTEVLSAVERIQTIGA